jgi:hypothetical protein
VTVRSSLLKGKAKRSPGGREAEAPHNGGDREELHRDEVDEDRQSQPAHLSDDEVSLVLKSHLQGNECTDNRSYMAVPAHASKHRPRRFLAESSDARQFHTCLSHELVFMEGLKEGLKAAISTKTRKDCLNRKAERKCIGAHSNKLLNFYENADLGAAAEFK